eukprot:Nk52_evm48s207 gene=Nk52_evmTU48s207
MTSSSSTSSSANNVPASILERVLAELEEDSVEPLKAAASKLLNMILHQERVAKDLLSKKCNGIALVLTALEFSSEVILCETLVAIVNALSSRSSKGAVVLVNRGASRVLLKCLGKTAQKGPKSENLTSSLLQTLADIAPKDKKIAVKARLNGVLPVLVSILKKNFNNGKVFAPALKLMKICSANGNNAICLGRIGAISTLASYISMHSEIRLAATHSHTLLHAMSAMANLSGPRMNISQVVERGVVKLMVSMSKEWAKKDQRQRWVDLRKAMLVVLKAVVSHERGKKAFIQAGGVNVCFNIFRNLNEGTEMDILFSILALLIKKCHSKQLLPVPKGPSRVFDIPCGARRLLACTGASDEEDSDEQDSSVKDDTNLPSIENLEIINNQSVSYSIDVKNLRPVLIVDEKELKLYDTFFPEWNWVKTKEDIIGEQPKNLPTKSVTPFVSVTPIHQSSDYTKTGAEPLYKKPPSLQKTIGFREIERIVSKDKFEALVVYDVHKTAPGKCEFAGAANNKTKLPPFAELSSNNFSSSSSSLSSSSSTLSSSSEKKKKKYGKSTPFTSCNCNTNLLHFESRFESGNLRQAILVGENEYDLLLDPDINTDCHLQWFFFQISNTTAHTSYKFNIINLEKSNSQFNFGMQPVFYSHTENESKGTGWQRTGTSILYYKNHYRRWGTEEDNNNNDTSGSLKSLKGDRHASFFTATFTITCSYENDKCFLAYHYPYTYTNLMDHLRALEASPMGQSRMQRQSLCTTLGGNDCPVLTISNFSSINSVKSRNTSSNNNLKDGSSSSNTTTGSNNPTYDSVPLVERKYIFISARVHPGESNSSWIMKGFLDFLLGPSEHAKRLCGLYVFKIVPMLNPDGVINGNHRCSLAGCDLNRQWIIPDRILHPTVYHTKCLLLNLKAKGKLPIFYCDFHGHSRKKMAFMYGCNNPSTLYDPEQDFPKILNDIAPAFSFKACRFAVEKYKESTARVVVYSEMGITRSYTLESSYCGADRGPYKGTHFGLFHLTEMGAYFAQALLELVNDNNSLTNSNSSSSQCVGFDHARMAHYYSDTTSSESEPE